jgi:hypothetical protein
MSPRLRLLQQPVRLALTQRSLHRPRHNSALKRSPRSTAPALLSGFECVVITDIPTKNGSSFVGSCGGLSDGVANGAFARVYGIYKSSTFPSTASFWAFGRS